MLTLHNRSVTRCNMIGEDDCNLLGYETEKVRRMKRNRLRRGNLSRPIIPTPSTDMHVPTAHASYCRLSLRFEPVLSLGFVYRRSERVLQAELDSRVSNAMNGEVLYGRAWPLDEGAVLACRR